MFLETYCINALYSIFYPPAFEELLHDMCPSQATASDTLEGSR